MTDSQKGFALTDALIAAAIAAGVAVTTAQSIGIAARSARSARDLSAVVGEAEIINTRFGAGLREDVLLDGFAGWTIESENILIEVRRGSRNQAKPQLYRFTHSEQPVFSFERIAIEAAQ